MSGGNYSESQLREALKAYGITPDSISFFAKGAYAEAYRVKDGDHEFVARVRSPEAKPEDVIFAGHWGKQVSEAVNVPVPLLPLEDVPQINYRCVDIAPFIEHDHTKGGDVDPDAWIKVGHWVGHLHRQGQPLLADAPVGLDYGNHPHRELFHRYLNQARVSAKEEHLNTLKIVDDLVGTIEDLAEKHKDDLLVGVVHGDMHFWNVLYTQNQPVAIIDFDFLQQGVLLHDIAYASIWLSWSERDRGEKWSNITEAYLSAYAEGRQIPLTDGEKICLPWFRAWKHIFFFLGKVAVSWNRVQQAVEEDLNKAIKIVNALT